MNKSGFDPTGAFLGLVSHEAEIASLVFELTMESVKCVEMVSDLSFS